MMYSKNCARYAKIIYIPMESQDCCRTDLLSYGGLKTRTALGKYGMVLPSIWLFLSIREAVLKIRAGADYARAEWFRGPGVEEDLYLLLRTALCI